MGPLCQMQAVWARPTGTTVARHKAGPQDLPSEPKPPRRTINVAATELIARAVALQ